MPKQKRRHLFIFNFRQMKKFIILLLKFSLFLLVFYNILIIFWGSFVPSVLSPNINFTYKKYGFTNTRLNEIKNFKNIDILFLGSSHAYRGFDTRIFDEAGLKSFNLGSSSQTPLQTEILLKRYLDSLNPKMILFEVSPVTFSLDGVESTLDIISNDKNDFNSIKLALKQNNLKIYNTLFYSYFHSFYRDLFDKKKYAEDIKKGNDTYISGGYVENQMKFFKHVDYPEIKWVFNETQFSALQRIIELVNKRNIKLIFIQAPSTSSFYKAHTNNLEFDERINKYGIYYNFNVISKLDDSLHFYDSHHLNQNGVEIFDNDVINLLFQKKSILRE